jgi:AcrR family transcriptional regulator
MSTKSAILETSLDLFNTQGYANVGVREIARQLNISPGNLSYHFPKKEDILSILLQRLKDANTALYEAYQNDEKNLHNFIQLMNKIFHSQYKFRGVYIGNLFIQQALQKSEVFDYKPVESNRKHNFRIIFKELVEKNELDANEEDIDFLVNFISLFGRFWIQEAFLLEKNQDKEKAIQHYIRILKHQLQHFATETGKVSLNSFMLS